MKKQTLSFIILLISLVIAPALKAQTVNIEAAVKYWELTDSLKQNKSITDAQWTTFTNLEGNKTYIRSVFDSASLVAYRRALEMVYMPKNDAWLQKNLKAKYWYAILIKRYKDQEDSLKTFLQHTLQSAAYKKKVYDYVYEYLPKKAHHPVKDLKVYYCALGMDATSQTNGIFYSLMSASNSAKIKPGVLEAHELHHQLRPQMPFKNIKPEHEGMLYAIFCIQNEGIADMIDKVSDLAQPGDPDEISSWLIKNAPATIKTLDSNIVVMAQSKGTKFEKERYYRNLLRSSAGHMPGFYMARTIVGNGYKKQMINTADNPFQFIYLYNRAAQKAGGHPPVFSAEAVAYLQELEKTYKK